MNDLHPLKEIVENLWMNEDWSQTNFGLGTSPEVLESVARQVAERINAPTDQVSAALQSKLSDYSFFEKHADKKFLTTRLIAFGKCGITLFPFLNILIRDRP